MLQGQIDAEQRTFTVSPPALKPPTLTESSSRISPTKESQSDPSP